GRRRGGTPGFLAVRHVVQAHANDLARVGNDRQQSQLVERMVGRDAAGQRGELGQGALADGTAQVGASGAQAAAQVVHVVAIDQAIAVTVGGAKRSQLHEPAFSPLHPMWAMPSISTRISALAPLASDFTSTRVQAGKSPVKNSLRAF